MLWEDTVDSLNVLCQERLREVGPNFNNLSVNFQMGLDINSLGQTRFSLTSLLSSIIQDGYSYRRAYSNQ